MLEIWGQIETWLNENGGVLTAALAIVSGVSFSIRWIIRNSRNPNAPTYGARRLIPDFFTSVRSKISEAVRSREKRSEGEIVIGYFGFAFDYLPLFIARKKNFFATLGNRTPIRYVKFDSYKKLQDSIAERTVDFVAMSSVPATRLKCADADIFAIELLSAHAQCIITPWVNVSVMRDLRNASIATTEYSSSHFGALYAFEKAGMPIDHDNLNFVTEDEGRGKFREGEVSAWAVWPLHSDYEVMFSSAREIIGSDVPVSV